MTLHVFVTGQAAFGEMAAQAVTDAGHIVTAACSPAYRAPNQKDPATPAGDQSQRFDRLRAWAWKSGTPWVDASQLKADHVPEDTDVILAAHSHAFVGRNTRARARLASVGYHPSLLPLHRGRDAVRWTIRDGDRVAGGSVYHLTDAVDGGPIAAQGYVLVPRDSTAQTLWRDLLAPLGVELITRTLTDLDNGRVVMVPQDESLATWEPSFDAPRLHRPELPELTDGSTDGLTYLADASALRGH